MWGKNILFTILELKQWRGDVCVPANLLYHYYNNNMLAKMSFRITRNLIRCNTDAHERIFLQGVQKVWNKKNHVFYTLQCFIYFNPVFYVIFSITYYRDWYFDEQTSLNFHRITVFVFISILFQHLDFNKYRANQILGKKKNIKKIQLL